MAVLTVRVEGSTAPNRMLESLERLESLKVEMVYPGHGTPFTDFRGAIKRGRKRLQGYLQDRDKMGVDLLKKILVYTLLMRPRFPDVSFFDYLMTTHWFPETVDFYFGGEYKAIYDWILNEFIQRKIVVRDCGGLLARVPP